MMASELVVKTERFDEPSPPAPALTPISVKLERQEVQAESSTSNRRRSARHIPLPPSPELESEDVKPDDDEVFVVGGIVAKSLNKGDGPWGAEHQYLIRWEGYAPKDDTWEWSSNVAQNARQMIDEFDKEEHPFSVLDVDLRSNSKKYLFESCAKKDSGRLWSPLAEKTWMRIGLLKLKRKISPESIKRAIEEFTSTALPTPPASERGKKRKHVSDDEEEEEEQKEDQRNIYKEGKYYTHRTLLEILDDHRYQKNHGPWRTRYKVRHRLRDRGRPLQTREEWYTNTHMLHVFGPVAVREKLKAYMPEQNPNTRADGTTIPVAEVSDYEKERLRRMKENEDLMKQLGLAL